MSWDSYIENLCAQSADGSGTQHCIKGVIIGMDGGAWTTNTHPLALKLLPNEGAAIARCFKSGNFTEFMTHGIKIEGNKYQFLRETDKKTVLAKKKDRGAMTLQASKTAIVIGHTAEGKQQGNTNKAVAVIAEYLESMNM